MGMLYDIYMKKIDILEYAKNKGITIPKESVNKNNRFRKETKEKDYKKH